MSFRKCRFCRKPAENTYCNSKCELNYEKFKDHACRQCGKYTSNLQDPETYYSSFTYETEISFCDDLCEKQYHNNLFARLLSECRKDIQNQTHLIQNLISSNGDLEKRIKGLETKTIQLEWNL